MMGFDIPDDTSLAMFAPSVHGSDLKGGIQTILTESALVQVGVPAPASESSVGDTAMGASPSLEQDVFDTLQQNHKKLPEIHYTLMLTT